jgi:hypothetical protein
LTGAFGFCDNGAGYPKLEDIGPDPSSEYDMPSVQKIMLTITAVVICEKQYRQYHLQIFQHDKVVFGSRHSYDVHPTSSHDVAHRYARYVHIDDFLRALRSHFIAASIMKSRKDGDALARAEFEKYAKHYEEIERSNGGLTYLEDVRWMELVKEENERLKSVKESMG